MAMRVEKLRVDKPSAGSTFKRPAVFSKIMPERRMNRAKMLDRKGTG